MSEGKQLIDTLKAELRRRDVTYQDLAAVLDLSHASVKRLFAEHNFTLERVEAICRFLGMDMAELFRIMEKKTAQTRTAHGSAGTDACQRHQTAMHGARPAEQMEF